MGSVTPRSVPAVGGKPGRNGTASGRRSRRGRRRDAERIGRQEDHFGSVTRFRHRLNNVVDVVDGVGDAGIFGLLNRHNRPYRRRVPPRFPAGRCGGWRDRYPAQPLQKLDGLGVAAPSKLNTPSSSQPCSSSPIRRRFGSVEGWFCRCLRGRRKWRHRLSRRRWLSLAVHGRCPSAAAGSSRSRTSLSSSRRRTRCRRSAECAR